jgi:phosphonate transport system permease protein
MSIQALPRNAPPANGSGDSAGASDERHPYDPPPRELKRSLGQLLGWAAVLAVLAWAWSGAEMSKLSDLVRDADNMARYAKGFLSPDFTHWRLFLEEMVVTVQIALWGTALAVLFGAPLALLSSSNLAPWWVVQPVRRAMDALRAINEFVFAGLFVVAVGLGPFAGVMAIFVHTTGVFAKLFSEAVEAVDDRPIEGIRATGATRIQEVVYGVLPQVLPHWISYALYRLESNVRSATVVGLVGAGGIGQILFEYIRGFDYAQTAAVTLIIIACVIGVDLLSRRIRALVI